ncbi:MAG: sigma-70 family RNA polymerase sigma factor [Bacteroidota bacterium]
MGPDGEVTRLLETLRNGDRGAIDELFPLVYRELHALAHRQLGHRRPGQTMNSTALVHEAYLKLVGQSEGRWQDRQHFFAVAATAMRHIIVDYARHRRALKRGGNARPTLLDEERVAVEDKADEILALDEALVHLSALDERLARTVELRFFAGLSIEEVAEVLDLSARTVKRDWRKARAFLYQMISEENVA